MTPTNSTKKRRAAESAMNLRKRRDQPSLERLDDGPTDQHATRSPTAKMMVPIVLKGVVSAAAIGSAPLVTTHSQSRRPHHSAKRNRTPRTMLQTLEATMLNPQATRTAPMNELPRYPAGRVMAAAKEEVDQLVA